MGGELRRISLRERSRQRRGREDPRNHLLACPDQQELAAIISVAVTRHAAMLDLPAARILADAGGFRVARRNVPIHEPDRMR